MDPGASPFLGGRWCHRIVADVRTGCSIPVQHSGRRESLVEARWRFAAAKSAQGQRLLGNLEHQPMCRELASSYHWDATNVYPANCCGCQGQIAYLGLAGLHGKVVEGDGLLRTL
jgi:hypothetical protein